MHVALVLVLLLAACTTFGASETPAETTLPPTPTAKPRHVVQRGPITGTIRAPGRLVAGNETPLSFPVAGRLRSVHVAVGDQVTQGHVVAELDTAAAGKQAEDAAYNLDVAIIRLEQARTKTANDQDLLLSRMNLERAEQEHRRARDRLAALEAGPPAVELRAAELAVLTAEIARDTAAGRLIAARRGPGLQELAAARSAAERARVGLAAAEAALAAEGSLADRGLSLEAAAVAKARADYDQARLAYDVKVQPSPTPDPLRLQAVEAELLAADAAVERAKRDLRQAEAERINPRLALGGAAPPEGYVAPDRVPEAQVALRKAELERDIVRRRLDLARTGVLAPAFGFTSGAGSAGSTLRTPAEIAADQAAARATIDQAKRALDRAELAAQAAAAARGKGLSPAEVAVADARLDYELALDRLRRQEAGVPPEEMAQLERAYAAAQASFEAAAVRLDALRAPAPERELRDAQDAVDQAAAAADVARAELAGRQAQLRQRDADLALDVKALERQVERERRLLADARQALAGTRLTAPFDGDDDAVEKKARDTVEGGDVVVLLADMSRVLMNATVGEADAAALAPGQPAAVVIPSLPGARIPATLVDVGATPLIQDGLNAIRLTLRLLEPVAGLRPGLPGEALFEETTRDNVLLVPTGALRTTGTRRFATLLLDRDREREIEVRTGLTSADGQSIEILAGLRESDTLLLPTTPPAGARG